MTPLLGHSITYRIAVGPQAGRKVFTLQTLPASDEPFDDGVGKVAGFSLHAGVAARADERKKLERLCRYISAGFGVHCKVAERVNSSQKLLDVGEKGIYSSCMPGCGEKAGRVGLGKESQMPERIFEEISEHGISHGITN